MVVIRPLASVACSEAWRKRQESQVHLLLDCNVVVKTVMRSFMMQWTGGREKV